MMDQTENYNVYLEITEDIIRERAAAYVPMSRKMAFVEEVADRCHDMMETGYTDSEDLNPVPPLFKESAEKKTRYMAAALCRLYLGFDFEHPDDDQWMMTEEDYEMFASGNPLNQLERIKKNTRDKDVQNKVFDLLADYKLLEKLLNAEVYGLMSAKNDIILRLNRLISASITPDAVKTLAEQADALQTELEGYRQTRNGQEAGT